MNDMRMRPQGNYLHTADWQELYVLGEHWQSDMAFYRDELKFLYSLVDKYFMWLMKDEGIAKLRTMTEDIRQIDEAAMRLTRQMHHHQRQLGLLMDKAFSEDARHFRAEHEQLENAFAAFVKQFRLVKQEVFDITEHMLTTERHEHLLTS